MGSSKPGKIYRPRLEACTTKAWCRNTSVPEISSFTMNDHVVAKASALRIHMHPAAIVTALLFTLRSRTLSAHSHPWYQFLIYHRCALLASGLYGSRKQTRRRRMIYSDSGRLGLHTTEGSGFNDVLSAITSMTTLETLASRTVRLSM